MVSRLASAASGRPVPVEVRRYREGTPWTYELLDARQRQVAARVRETREPGAFLLNELAPVITFGRRATHSELLMAPEFLARAGVSLYETDRGGLATYHGPGQWVLFAVDRLERLTGDSRGVRKAVEGLLESALAVGRSYEPRAEIRSGAETGVWTPRGKFAAVGVQIQDGVLLHGLSINGLRTPTSFLGLRPCGLEAPVDFLLGERGSGEVAAAQDQAFEEMGARLLDAAFERFYSFLPESVLTEGEA